MSPTTLRILIVDDDPDIRDSLTDVLVDQGYHVATSADGVEALDYLRSEPAPCLILLDYTMPRCDGAQFRAAQRGDPAIADIPVVLLTADVRIDDKRRSIDAVDHLGKPVPLDRLLDILRRYC